MGNPSDCRMRHVADGANSACGTFGNQQQRQREQCCIGTRAWLLVGHDRLGTSANVRDSWSRAPGAGIVQRRKLLWRYGLLSKGLRVAHEQEWGFVPGKASERAAR